MNDEIERMLFGSVDRSGAPAVRAFMEEDKNAWIRHFQTLFSYIDTQKLRTPKGLAWLRAQYPSLTQDELMQEMQGIRMMNCTIWSQGVREIVSAEASDVSRNETQCNGIHRFLTPNSVVVRCGDLNDGGLAGNENLGTGVWPVRAFPPRRLDFQIADLGQSPQQRELHLGRKHLVDPLILETSHQVARLTIIQQRRNIGEHGLETTAGEDRHDRN
nr:hypothetical protein [uncultured Brevundimonas sp.]